MRERCSCIVGLFSYVAPSSWCDACNSRILMHSPTDNETISADVDTDSLYGQDIGQIDTYASLGRSSCLAGPNMLKLELFWSQWLVFRYAFYGSGQRAIRKLHGVLTRIFGGGSVLGTLGAAIYSSKS